MPARLGYEAAGTVDALGEGVAGFALGEPVDVIPSFSMNEYATYGDLIVVPASAVVQQPASLSFVQAASIWMMFVTAYSALIEDANVTKGDFVVVPAASSSVGLAAIQTRQLCRSHLHRAHAHISKEETAARSRCDARGCHE